MAGSVFGRQGDSRYDFEKTFATRDELVAYLEDEVLMWIGEIYDIQLSIDDVVISGDTATVEYVMSQDVENLALRQRVRSHIQDVTQLKRILGRWYISHVHTEKVWLD